jgi:hypothetical protein
MHKIVPLNLLMGRVTWCQASRTGVPIMALTLCIMCETTLLYGLIFFIFYFLQYNNFYFILKRLMFLIDAIIRLARLDVIIINFLLWSQFIQLNVS